MNNLKKAKYLVVLGVMLAVVNGVQAAKFYYEVEITNLTKGQIFSPAVVAIHSDKMSPVFEAGSVASPELAGVAEDAMLDPLVALLESDPQVGNVAVLAGSETVILPGETASVVFEGNMGQKFRRLSLVGMLVSTNDAFYGLSSAEIGSPYWPWLLNESVNSFYAPAYDSGSEVNSESCVTIPGPPCGNGGVRDEDGAEAYIYVHSGIHGVGDLEPAEFNWHNPVAKVVVRVLKRIP